MKPGEVTGAGGREEKTQTVVAPERMQEGAEERRRSRTERTQVRQ